MGDREVRNLWSLDRNGTLSLNFHEGQAKVWLSERRFIWMFAGTQGGKTSLGPWWLWREIARMGAGDYFVATTTYGLFSLKLMPEMKTVFITLLKIARWKGGVFEVRPDCDPTKQFTDPPWARIILRSAHVKESLESATVKAAWIDECGMDRFKLHIWEALQRRLSLHQGRVLGTTTLYNRGWLRTAVYEPWLKGDTTHDVIQFKSTLNPSFPQEEYDRIKLSMPQWKVKMFYEGQFDTPPGIIFDCFDPSVHVIRAFPVPKAWPVVVCVDPVGVYTCALWLAWDMEHSQIHVYREYYEPFGRTTKEHVLNIMAEGQLEPVIGYVGTAASERQARKDWRAAGMPIVPPPHNIVESGIAVNYALIKGNALVIHDTCTHLMDELGTYQREIDEAGEPTMKIVDKDSYHALDALRYGTSALADPDYLNAEVVYSPVQIQPSWAGQMRGVQGRG